MAPIKIQSSGGRLIDGDCMIYLVSDKVSSFGWLNYSDNNVLDADDFYQGYRVGNSGAVVQFQLSAKCSVKKIERQTCYLFSGRPHPRERGFSGNH